MSACTSRRRSPCSPSRHSKPLSRGGSWREGSPAARTPTEGLAASRRADSLRKRQRVLDAVQRMPADGEPITFTTIARTAKVSTWLVCAEGVRGHVEAAIRQQLGRQLDQVGNQQLTARISELTNANRRLEQETAQLQPLKERVDELEKDLAAARSGLRKMIRAENA
ncbi:DUF6262 family protein [Streptomyces sp. NPDC050433]|uniref:DUF6262 family protein n=1 Tax=unclassified Streptomyces TaxID=2593676 RepID=UPI00342431DA